MDNANEIDAVICAEQIVIGAMIKNPDVIPDAVEIITENDFMSPVHRKYFSLITSMFNNDDVINLITVCENLPSTALDQLSDYVMNATTVNIPAYAAVVKNASRKRLALTTLNRGVELITRCIKIDDGLNELQSLLVDMEPDNIPYQPIDAILKNRINALDERYRSDGYSGLMTGFHRLDDILMGIQPTDYVVIAGRPSMGKTTLAMNISENISDNANVLFFSLEMSRDQLVDKMICSQGGIYLKKYRSGKISDYDWTLVQNSADKIKSKKIHIIDKPGMHINEIAAVTRSYARKMKLAAVFVDYLQLIDSSEKDRFQQISKISRQLKTIAKINKTPIIALSQLSRECEKRTDREGGKRPMNSDLRESGQIEQDADIIVFTYRDEYYNEESQWKGICELIVSKQRNGETGTVMVQSELDRSRFVNLENNFQPINKKTSGFQYDER